MNPAVNRSPQSPQPKSPEKLVRPTRPEPIAQPQTSDRQEAVPDLPPEKPPEEPKSRQQPIPPPGEPMQYRAIGLVRGQYLPSAEQFTQGMLLADDETLIDSVLLGRVMSLVKNHIDLSQPHLWVVYPRTRKEDDKLHLQIVGVWEPETLDRENEAESSGSNPAIDRTGDNGGTIVDGYFSIRGEIVYQSQPEQQIVVKIRQLSRQQSEKSKFFKLHLQCSLSDRMVGHFWDLQVLRQERLLVVREGKDIGFLPLKKKPKPSFSKRPVGQKPQFPKREERLPMATSPSERKPLPKPIKRQGPVK